MRTIYQMIQLICSVFYHFIVNPAKKSLLQSCGSKVTLEKGCKAYWANVALGNDVHIGEDNRFMCTDAMIKIGDHVMFGPDVTVITGDHRIDIIGRYMSTIRREEKRSFRKTTRRLSSKAITGLVLILLF